MAPPTLHTILSLLVHLLILHYSSVFRLVENELMTSRKCAVSHVQNENGELIHRDPKLCMLCSYVVVFSG